MPKTTQMDCLHICNCLCHNPQLLLFEKSAMHTTALCCDGKCDYCDSYISLGQRWNHIKECHPEMIRPQKDCVHICRCPCHDPEFASVSKHKDGDICCDGKCEYCGSFIVRNHMEQHVAECHRYINAITMEVPYWLRKSSS